MLRHRQISALRPESFNRPPQPPTTVAPSSAQPTGGNSASTQHIRANWISFLRRHPSTANASHSRNPSAEARRVHSVVTKGKTAATRSDEPWKRLVPATMTRVGEAAIDVASRNATARSSCCILCNSCPSRSRIIRWRSAGPYGVACSPRRCLANCQAIFRCSAVAGEVAICLRMLLFQEIPPLRLSDVWRGRSDGHGRKGVGWLGAQSAGSGRPSAALLASSARNLMEDKWDWTLPLSLLQKAYGYRHFDVSATQRTCQEIMAAEA